MIPLEAQYIPQNETLVKGQVYGYKSLNPLFQFTVHRFVDYNGENVIFKGDSNEFTESIPRNYVVWKLVKVRK